MKVIKAIFFTICLTLMNVLTAFAQDDGGGDLPPEPGGPPDQPPGGRVPIDEHIFILLILAIVLGGIMIYRYKIKKALQ
ncbi:MULTISPECIES: hypothetical protein [unclassified Flavobacterium]|uniref:hypothetical protein n=1 Tax=unclassified Flavobacterium TaxID=196869 RepID=UPI0012A7893F|nr:MULTISPECIES: hypothetical protein [unclassified Flavobacterium]MBF4486514.1 hypothetical protein [Flavobacterium sp. CSZ]QGK76579.1 hypothetical protein GIY83_21645 [Flavobacterium sp. SLB02]